MAKEHGESHMLDLNVLYEMAQLYYDEYKYLFDSKTDLLRRATILKLKAIKACTAQKQKALR